MFDAQKASYSLSLLFYVLISIILWKNDPFSLEVLPLMQLMANMSALKNIMGLKSSSMMPMCVS